MLAFVHDWVWVLHKQLKLFLPRRCVQRSFHYPGSFTFSNLSHVLWRPCHGCRHWRAGAPLWWFGGARWAQLGRGAWQFVRRPSCIQMFSPNYSRNENNWKTIFVDDLLGWIWCTRWMLQFWSRLRRSSHKLSSMEGRYHFQRQMREYLINLYHHYVFLFRKGTCGSTPRMLAWER